MLVKSLINKITKDLQDARNKRLLKSMMKNYTAEARYDCMFIVYEDILSYLRHIHLSEECIKIPKEDINNFITELSTYKYTKDDVGKYQVSSEETVNIINREIDDFITEVQDFFDKYN